MHNYANRRIYDELLEAVTAFDLVQLVKEKTWARVYNNNDVRMSTLDHVYTNNIEGVETVTVLKQEISDHSLVMIETVGLVRERVKEYFTYVCWKNYSKEALLELIAKADTRSMEDKSAQVIADELDQLFGEICDVLLPVKVVIKRNNELIYSLKVIQMKRKLKNMYKRVKKKEDVQAMKRCRTFEKQIRREIMESKRTKIRAEAELGPKNLWKAVKIALDKSPSVIPDIDVENDRTVTMNKEKTEIFADYFHRKINLTKEESVIQEGVYNGKRKVFGLHNDNWITRELVEKMIEDLKPKRCQGFDRVPVILLKDGKQLLLDVITSLMRKVIETGVIPEQWKCSKVIPLLKTGNARSVKNYRPISNLCSLTKILEKLILTRLKTIESREQCDLTGEFQHGFKEGRSTETACLEIQSRIAAECDNNNYVAVASFDMTAAFDMVNHGLLKKRMKLMGLPLQIVRVVMNWLEGRTFYCELGGEVSRLYETNEGTVQGSILGPVLFAIFMSPLSDIIDNLITFADDNYKICIGRSELEALTQCEMESAKIIKWIKESGLVVNENKTEVCLFHRFDARIKTIDIGTKKVEVSGQMKILGIIFDSKLTWYNQACKSIASANKAKQALRLIARYFTSAELLKLSTAYFYSRLYYGAKVWLMTTLTSVVKKKLFQASSRMLRIVDKDFLCQKSFMSLHKQYGRATPEMWTNYVTANAMYNVITKRTPECIMLRMMLNTLHNDRHLGMRFTRSNKVKYGFNCLSNRLQKVSSMIVVDWMVLSTRGFKLLSKKLFIIDHLSRA